jgi:hypothetical protein
MADEKKESAKAKEPEHSKAKKRAIFIKRLNEAGKKK